MRDSDLIFGKASITTDAVGAYAPDILGLISSKDSTGIEPYWNVTAIPSRDILATEKLSISLDHCATEGGTYKPACIYDSVPDVAIQAGQRVKFSMPREVLQYLKAKATVTKVSGTFGGACTVEIFLECN